MIMLIVKLIYYWTLFAPFALPLIPRRICRKYKFRVIFILGPFAWFVWIMMGGVEMCCGLIDTVINYIKRDMKDGYDQDDS